MIDNSTIQDAFFKQIKTQTDGKISMVDEIADLLHISNDSAYRRIRGETSLTFQEIGLLSNKYGISVDRLAMGHSNQVAFRYKPLDETKFTFADEAIKPGKSGSIHVTFDTNKKYDWQDRKLIIMSNAKNNPETIRFKVMVDNK